jgi:hypothetical protein
MEYLGAWGTLIHEKNLKSKISCQTPFNDMKGTLHKNDNCLAPILNFVLFHC